MILSSRLKLSQPDFTIFSDQHEGVKSDDSAEGTEKYL